MLTPHCRRLGGRELLAAGFEHPRIAVAGLNPHNGDGGVFGSEEIDVIGPAVSELVAEIGENISGPFPSDTIFLKAVAGEVDAVVTVPPSSPPSACWPPPPFLLGHFCSSRIRLLYLRKNSLRPLTASLLRRCTTTRGRWP